MVNTPTITFLNYNKMTKDLEQLRLNMILTLMEMNEDALMEVKNFLETDMPEVWKEQISDESVQFIDYSKISKVSKDKEDKSNIIFL